MQGSFRFRKVPKTEKGPQIAGSAGPSPERTTILISLANVRPALHYYFTSAISSMQKNEGSVLMLMPSTLKTSLSIWPN